MPEVVCECGEVLHYDKHQGGNSVRCRCGDVVFLPRIRRSAHARSDANAVTAEAVAKAAGLRDRRVWVVVAGATLLAVAVVVKPYLPSMPTAVLDSTQLAVEETCSPVDSGETWSGVANGSNLKLYEGASGYTLTFLNGISADAAVRLIDTHGVTRRKIFVSAGQRATLERIAAGAYRIQFEYGRTYLRSLGQFCHSDGDLELADPVLLGTAPTDSTVRVVADMDTVTLHLPREGATRVWRPIRRPTAEPDDSSAVVGG